VNDRLKPTLERGCPRSVAEPLTRARASPTVLNAARLVSGERPVKEVLMSTPIIDPDPPGLADSLDITGDWSITYSWAPEQAPLASRDPTYHVHFEVTGRGTHGGVEFTGAFLDDPGGPPPRTRGPAPPPGVFHGETLYDGRGVHLVQMVMYAEVKRYYELHSGKHYVDLPPGEPVQVNGAWVDVGASRDSTAAHGQGYFGQFRMLKL
jgi:hypothetical protein